jgi:ribosomal protein S12 methylthiotransferase accessory factor
MTMEIFFPGGRRVATRYKGHVVETDQPPSAGGTDTAPAPFDLFLSALGACAGIYALRFCQERGLPTEGLGLTLDASPDPAAKRLAEVRIALHLPAGFPEKYRAAILRAVDQCAVKRQILDPPRFVVETVSAAALVG